MKQAIVLKPDVVNLAQELGYRPKFFNPIGARFLLRGNIYDERSSLFYELLHIKEWLDEKFRVRVFTDSKISGHYNYSIWYWLGGARGWERTYNFNSSEDERSCLLQGINEAIRLINDKAIPYQVQ
jgi:hypothetical protein